MRGQVYSRIIIINFFCLFFLKCSQPSTQCLTLENGLKNEPYLGESLDSKQITIGFELRDLSDVEDISNYLSGHNISAIFFIEGKNLGSETNSSRVRSIINSGHRIGNVGYQLEEIRKNRSIETQFRSVDYVLTKSMNDSLFFLRFVDDDFSKSATLNKYGFGKYIGPIGNSALGLKDVMKAACTNKSLEQLCIQEMTSFIQALNKGIIIFPFFESYEAPTNIVKAVINRLQQSGFQFLEMRSVPEISKEIELRKIGDKKSPCDDYSRN